MARGLLRLLMQISDVIEEDVARIIKAFMDAFKVKRPPAIRNSGGTMWSYGSHHYDSWLNMHDPMHIPSGAVWPL